MITTPNDRVADRRHHQRRVAVAGALSALALAAGAGAASAAEAPAPAPVETGYAVVVDEGAAPTTAGGLCPDGTGSTDGDL